MAAPVIQFKRGVLADLPGSDGEPGFTTDAMTCTLVLIPLQEKTDLSVQTDFGTKDHPHVVV